MEFFLTIKNNVYRHKSVILFIAFFSVLLIWLWSSSSKYFDEIPTKGGEIAEIQIGTNLRFINPVLARSNAEKDLLPLIYSSLLKRNPQGDIVPGIADIELSKNNTVYTVTLQDNIFFSNGKKLTTDDVIFTIDKINDPELNSPYFGNWFGIEYKKVDDQVLTITLPQEYKQFKEILSSFYVLPQEPWNTFSPSEFEHNPLNIQVVGSGPYVVDEVVRSQSGKIEKYVLTRNMNHYQNNTYIDDIVFYFFDTYQEYQDSLIFSNKKMIKNIANVHPGLIEELSSSDTYINSTVEKIDSPKIFGLFLNSKQEGFLKNKSLRKSISQVINKNTISDVTLGGYAQVISSPIFSLREIAVEEQASIDAVRALLPEDKYNFLESPDGAVTLMETKADFPEQPVVLTLKTIDSEEFIEIAKNIQNDLKKIGVKLNIIYYSEDFLANSIVRSRDFDMLLFGYKTSLNPDLFYFFHSSQVADPGINISNTMNTEVDKNILELRKDVSAEKELSLIQSINSTILQEYSFIPLYSPYFTYIMDTRVNNFTNTVLNSREERFSNISDWYIETKKVLPE